MKSQLLFGGLPILPGSNRSSTVEFLKDPDRLLYRVGTPESRAQSLRLPLRPCFVREQEWFPCSLGCTRGKQTVAPLCTNAAAYCSKLRNALIMTSVDLKRAAATSPDFSRISLAASAVIIAVTCCSPIATVTWANSPSYFTSSTRPLN